MYEYLIQNPWVIVLVAGWSLIWKGIALWKSAQRGQKAWYVIMLIVNTLGILEIIYLLTAAKKTEPNA
jgi:methionyl-tRNA synthetase